MMHTKTNRWFHGSIWQECQWSSDVLVGAKLTFCSLQPHRFCNFLQRSGLQIFFLTISGNMRLFLRYYATAIVKCSPCSHDFCAQTTLTCSRESCCSDYRTTVASYLWQRASWARVFWLWNCAASSQNTTLVFVRFRSSKKKARASSSRDCPSMLWTSETWRQRHIQTFPPGNCIHILDW